MNKSSTDPFTSGVMRFPLPPLSAEEKAQLKSMFRNINSSNSSSFSSRSCAESSPSAPALFLKPLDEEEREELRVLKQKGLPTQFEVIMGKRKPAYC